jgi:serine/threonine-protein kinase
MALRIGETFAGYRILRLLGSGGMGEVYLVQHPRLPRQEALKILRPDISSDPSFRERFIREAELAAGLRHPHIVAIHDRGEQDGQLWIAMDHVDGTDLAHQTSQRYPAGMPIDLAQPIIAAVASALDYAHKKGLLHRDVKPANIIVADLDADEPTIFLADFGIARPLDDTSGITTTNMTVGTVAYAAPEQLMGESMDGRADQYALAATTHHLLTGLQLFPHSNPAVVISRHLNTIPPRMSEHHPHLTGLDTVLQTSLAKNPADRHPSCTAFAHALTGASHGAPSASPSASTQAALPSPASAAAEPTQAAGIHAVLPSSPAPARSLHLGASGPSRRRRQLSWGAGGVAAMVLIAAGVWAIPRLTGDHPKDGPGSSSSASAPASIGLAAPPSGSSTAQGAAESIRAAIPNVTALIALTEQNDANNLIGRPNGYIAATVMVDSRISRTPLCTSTDAGVDCGATVEQWPDEGAAQKRAEYIQTVRGSVPIVGQEWTTVQGTLILRVTGDLTPSDAEAYKAAFTDSGNETDAANPTHNTVPAPNSKEALEIKAHELDIVASQGDAAAAYEFYSRRCKDTIGDLDSYKAFLVAWREGRKPQYSGVTVKVNGSSAQVVSIDNDPNAPASTMNPRTWTFIDGSWQFDNC